MTKRTEQGNEYKKGLWTVEEDSILLDYVKNHGKGQWNRIAKKTGLKRCGKSCRLRWMNYLSPTVKRGNFTDQEEDLIIRLHKLLGNRWSLIAKRVPGRTDNQVKNYWNTHLSKKLGIKDPNTKMSESKLINIIETKKTCEETETPTSSEPCENSSFSVKGSETVMVNNTNSMNRFGGGGIDEVPDIQAAEMSGANLEENYINTLWIPEDDFELSTLTMLDFMDGYCF